MGVRHSGAARNDRYRGPFAKEAELPEESAMPSDKRSKRPHGEPKPDAGPGPHYVADEPTADAPDATVHSPTTDTGLSVEEQIRKELDPKRNGGLPTSLKTGSR
jgi:hypothetical protein